MLGPGSVFWASREAYTERTKKQKGSTQAKRQYSRDLGSLQLIHSQLARLGFHRMPQIPPKKGWEYGAWWRGAWDSLFQQALKDSFRFTNNILNSFFPYLPYSCCCSSPPPISFTVGLSLSLPLNGNPDPISQTTSRGSISPLVWTLRVLGSRSNVF